MCQIYLPGWGGVDHVSLSKGMGPMKKSLGDHMEDQSDGSHGKSQLSGQSQRSCPKREEKCIDSELETTHK